MSKVSQHSPYSSGPLVFGAGLMRTGTNSQMKALEILLGGRCYHMKVLLNERPAHLRLWYKATIDGMTKALADELLDGFAATTDFPAAHFYPEFAQIYPNAKFVLSIRDPKRWVQSVRATIQQGNEIVEKLLPPVRWLLGVSCYLPLIKELLDSRLGFRFDLSDEDMIRAFEAHKQSVIRTIPNDRLLVFQVSDGWEPLCNFLDLAVPSEPFPNVNDTEEFQRELVHFRCLATVYNTAFCSVVGACAWFGAKYCLQKWC